MNKVDKRSKPIKTDKRKKRSKTTHTIKTLEAMSKWQDDCLIWNGYSIDGKHPQVCHDGKMWMVRKLVMHLNGRQLPAKAYYKPVCGDPHCIRIEHIKVVDSIRHMVTMAKSVNQSSPARIAKLQQAAINRRKLTDEQVQEIITSDQSSRALAQIYGVSKSTITKVRAYRARRNVNASVNPFVGLMR